jgi:hypothetical protein
MHAGNEKACSQEYIRGYTSHGCIDTEKEEE